jgi:hypothetical protein
MKLDHIRAIVTNCGFSDFLAMDDNSISFVVELHNKTKIGFRFTATKHGFIQGEISFDEFKNFISIDRRPVEIVKPDNVDDKDAEFA